MLLKKDRASLVVTPGRRYQAAHDEYVAAQLSGDLKGMNLALRKIACFGFSGIRSTSRQS